MSNYKIIYYDDENDEQGEPANIKRVLERYTGWNIELLPPPVPIDAIDIDKLGQASLILIDYELSHPQPSGHKVGYGGITLTSQIRSYISDRPIVVISRGDILNKESREHLRLLKGRLAFDALILKNEVYEDKEFVIATLKSLMEGYDSLRTAPDLKWPTMLSLLGVTDDKLEQVNLRDTAPPLQTKENTLEAVAEWIRRVVIYYPGILYDDIHAATNLGLALDSFLNPKVQSYLLNAQYTGAFSTVHSKTRRWWKNRLELLAMELMAQQQVDGLVNPHFRMVLASHLGLELDPPICIWDKKPGADYVCCLLEKPVKYRHTLRYMLDDRPGVMDEARVSFRAIQESSDFQQDMLDEASQELLQGVLDMVDPGLEE